MQFSVAHDLLKTCMESASLGPHIDEQPAFCRSKMLLFTSDRINGGFARRRLNFFGQVCEI
jgi:hypothetical protein